MTVAPQHQQHEFPNGLVLVAEAIPGVQSAAFTLLLPAGAAYESPQGAGAATMLSEWIMRGAGERDSRDLLGVLDYLGVSHSESAQTVHTSLAAATLGRNLIPAACSIASRLGVPLRCSSLANSTIRMPCLLISPISVTRPTSV